MIKPGPTPTYAAPYGVCARKTLHSALCHLLQTEFPSVFGPAVTKLFADTVSALFERFQPPQSGFRMGQVFWTAVAIDDPPTQNKRIENTRLVPVVLDLVSPQDIDAAATKGLHKEARCEKIVRLFRQAYEQKGVLSLADVSLLLHIHMTTVSNVVTDYERRTGQIVPRRGTVHDLGRSVTHKAIICYKRLVEKKSTSQVAKETYHSETEVEYYVQFCRRIQLCRDNGLSPEQTKQATGHSLALINQYLNLVAEFGLRPLPNTEQKDGVQSPESERPPTAK